MFNWEGCPPVLFDMYIEVGEVKIVPGENPDLPCIELWLGSGFAKSFSRPECGKIRRRPVYGVFKQIRKLCSDKKACILFMCDDDETGYGNDTDNWADALGFLLHELFRSDLVECSAAFTRKSHEQILARCEGSFHSDRDREAYISFYRTLDILVTRQANPYASPKYRQIIVRREESLPLMNWLFSQ